MVVVEKKVCFLGSEEGASFIVFARKGDTVEWQVQRSLVAHACMLEVHDTHFVT